MAINNEDIAAELGRLRAENEALREIVRLRADTEELRKAASQGLSMKVSAKGGLSVYGLGRFPVTLYKEQWHRLLALADELREFMQKNEDKFRSRS